MFRLARSRAFRVKCFSSSYHTKNCFGHRDNFVEKARSLSPTLQDISAGTLVGCSIIAVAT